MEYYNILEVLNCNTLERVYIYIYIYIYIYTHNIYNYFIYMRIWRTEKNTTEMTLKNTTTTFDLKYMKTKTNS